MKNSKEFAEFRHAMKEAIVREFGEDRICPFWGNQGAKIVSISQAPSSSVIKYQRPFADKSGERLRREWYKVTDQVFYNPDNFYFTAIGMYFPGKDKKGGDLKPSLRWAKDWLSPELSYLSPNLYLVVGSLAASFFFPGSRFEDLVLRDQQLNGRLALVLPHPSPANIKWFKDNPGFEMGRLALIRKRIHQALSLL